MSVGRGIILSIVDGSSSGIRKRKDWFIGGAVSFVFGILGLTASLVTDDPPGLVASAGVMVFGAFFMILSVLRASVAPDHEAPASARTNRTGSEELCDVSGIRLLLAVGIYWCIVCLLLIGGLRLMISPPTLQYGAVGVPMVILGIVLALIPVDFHRLASRRRRL